MLVSMPTIQRILRLDPSFPTKLLDLPRWPAELQVHGRLAQEGLAVAIVGARGASASGMQAAYGLAAELARKGHRVISGGALGIDAAAHRGALSAGGYTLAVMACGLDAYYPRRNAKLFDKILGSGGAMVSPFALGQLPMRSHFVRRNEVIAALSDVVVVVEAAMDSGSLHTARFALSHRRPLAAYAKSPGCESLLAGGVPNVQCADDVLDLLAGKARILGPTLVPAKDSPEALVLSKLTRKKARSASIVATEAGLPLRQTQRILHRLQLESLAVLRPGQLYVRSQLAQGPDFD